MARLVLLLVAALALAGLSYVPTAAADHPCEDVRDATGVGTCWPFWLAECVEGRPAKTKLGCLDGGEPHGP